MTNAKIGGFLMAKTLPDGILCGIVDVRADRLRTEVRTMPERSVSVYDNKKVKLILSVSQHHRAKFYAIAKMYGVTMNFLATLLIDEMYYEPLAPKLPQRIENAEQRVHNFFIKREPAWKNNRIKP